MIKSPLISLALALVLTSGLQAQGPQRPSTEVPEGINAELDEVFATHGEREMLMDIFRPEGEETLPCIVVVHGGGWIKGEKEKFRALSIHLAQRGYVTAAISYRLAGEAKFPAAIHDCNEATRFLRANAERFHLDPKRIGAVGGSAGGHLVGLMAAAPDDPDLNPEGADLTVSARLKAAIVMAGPLDLTTGPIAERSNDPEKSMSYQWLGGSYSDMPEIYRKASPLFYFSEQTPPLLFLCGELDNPERNAPAREKLEELGVPTGIVVFDGARHGAWNIYPYFDDFVEKIDEWMHAQL